MDSRCTTTWEDVKNVQMDLKYFQTIQSNHSERLLKLEKRQADDAALKSVWGSSTAFPNVLSGVPRPDPSSNLHNDIFDKLDSEEGQNILKSLHLEDEEEPVRRVTSRANSVRFDVTTLQNSSWAASARNSGDFISVRPSSGFGNNSMMERSLSHKSDGRQSSGGQSLTDSYFNASGRTSSLGLDTNFEIGDLYDKDYTCENINNPPPGLFLLGSVPSIIRCWLAPDFTHDSLLYAAVCSGSQKSILHYNLVKELGVQHLMRKDHTGRNFLKMTIYLPEATIIYHPSRVNSPISQLPSLSVDFEVIGLGQQSNQKKNIFIFLGSDILRSQNSDILFSQNLMTIYADDGNKLSVPFIRPEDDEMFKNLRVTNLPYEKACLKATATPFTPTDAKTRIDSTLLCLKKVDDPIHKVQLDSSKIEHQSLSKEKISSGSPKVLSNPKRSSSLNSVHTALPESVFNVGEHGIESKHTTKPETETTVPESSPRKTTSVIWGSWRQEKNRTWSQSGYQPAKRGGRSMKILKPSSKLNSASCMKSSSSLAPHNSSSSIPYSSSSSSSSPSPSLFQNTSSYDSPSLTSGQTSSSSSEQHGKKYYLTNKSEGGKGENGYFGKWDNDQKNNYDEPRNLKNIRESCLKANTGLESLSNPIGGASAFSWMNSGKTKEFVKSSTSTAITTTFN